ncbi:hypothetical protein NHB34_01315 [Polynucleobacter sp. MWH-UH19D]|uniref:DUF5672 family protein n=1 Tax=Polynucleobacter sp. MWH-UH19D TaxID=1855610 RepID=UPI003364E243
MMLSLPNVTLLCVETRDPNLAHWAIKQCTEKASFSQVVLITNLGLLKEYEPNIKYVAAPNIQTTKDYSDLLLTGIEEYVSGTHVLIIQWDSFIIRSDLWQDHFLTYDYIGPVWPHHPENPVGNGGFSLRSVKLLKAIKQPGFVKKHPEDYCICVDNREFLEKKYGIHFAPAEIAEQFAVERSLWHPAFGFHGFFNFGYVLDDDQLSLFLNLMPASGMSGIDTYDLITSLRHQNRNQLAIEIADRVKFKWKMRRHFFKLKWWLLTQKFK